MTHAPNCKFHGARRMGPPVCTCGAVPSVQPDAVSDTGRMRVKIAAALEPTVWEIFHEVGARGGAFSPVLEKARQQSLVSADAVLATLEPDAGLRGEVERLTRERDETRAAIFGSANYSDCLKHGNFLEMIRATEAGRLGAIACAEAAEAKLATEGQNAEASLRASLMAQVSKLPQFIADNSSNNGEPMVKLHEVKKAIRAALASTAPADTAEVA